MTAAPYLNEFEAFSANGGASPDWLAPVRKRAFGRFAEVGFPTSKDEEWRFTSVTPIASRQFSAPPAATVTAAELEPFIFGHPEWPAEFQYESARVERAIFDGEPVVLGFATRRGREALEQVLRIEERDGGIARLRGYAFCPETMREVGAALGLRVRTGLYRYPTPAPGVLWK